MPNLCSSLERALSFCVWILPLTPIQHWVCCIKIVHQRQDSPAGHTCCQFPARLVFGCCHASAKALSVLRFGCSTAMWPPQNCLAAQPENEGEAHLWQCCKAGGRAISHAGSSILKELVGCLPSLRGQQRRHSRMHHSAIQQTLLSGLACDLERTSCSSAEGVLRC